MAQVKLELHLPGLVIGVDDIRTVFKRNRQTGPFIIISRACGLALDAKVPGEQGNQTTLWPPHGLKHQLWHLRPSGIAGEAVIVSASSSLALDSTISTEDAHPILWEVHCQPWQRWRFEVAPDGVGYLIQSMHSRLYLSAAEHAERGWNAWFEGRHARLSQQWLVSVPFGRAIY